jgi:predicted phosphodiesterase
MSAKGGLFVRVCVPDSHGEHIDRPARDAFLRDLRRLDAHEIVMLGDHLDAGGTFSSHQRSYTNELTESYDADCQAANAFLDCIQRAAPKATIHYLEGNHEQHVERWASRTFASHKDAVKLLDCFGPQKVLDLKRRGIRYYLRSEQYQGISIPGTIKLGKCYFVHGVSHSRHATAAHLARFGANVVHGHTHRSQATVERTVSSDGFGAWCPGTLAKLQPLYKHTAPTGWSHGFACQFVHRRSGRFMHVNVPIMGGRSLLMETVDAMSARKGKR